MYTYCTTAQRYRDSRTGRFISLEAAMAIWLAMVLGAAAAALHAPNIRGMLAAHPDGNLSRLSAFQLDEQRRVRAWND